MIFYFTATGNSLSAARSLAAATGDDLVDIGSAYRAAVDSGFDTFDYTLPQTSDLGFVFPVQAWSTPGIIDDFIRRLHLMADDGGTFKPGYTYCVITCGAFVGNAARFFADMLRRHQGLSLDASFSIASVGNCVYLYDVPDPTKTIEVLSKASSAEKDIAFRVAAHERVHGEHRNPIGILMSHITCDETKKKRDIRPFHVIESCTGCGICAKVCPTGTICMVDGHPSWTGDSCTQCLACLHRCPVHASQYGKNTIRRGRYLNPAMEERNSR